MNAVLYIERGHQSRTSESKTSAARSQWSKRKTRAHRELARAVPDSKAPAIPRAAALLRALGKGDGPLGLQALGRELGLVPSTCLHVLRDLVGKELVSFDADTKR